jgi:type IV pilus assembly protein PilX
MTPARPLRPRQRGIVLIYTLIALVVILIAGAALIRRMDNALIQTGNMAFKQELVRQALRALAKAKTELNTGALTAETTRNADLKSANYSAIRLASNAQGIPSILVDDSTYTSAGWTAADLTDSDTGVTLRYVIDRQCDAAGDFSTVNCVTMADPIQTSADALYKKINGESHPVYRISIRASGPRNTQAYFQATVSR